MCAKNCCEMKKKSGAKKIVRVDAGGGGGGRGVVGVRGDVTGEVIFL